MKIKKAVIPAAGLGTRVLPASKVDAQRDAADCGQARHPVHCGGSGQERHRGHPDHHQPRQNDGGGPLRPHPRAGSNAAGHAAKQDVYDQVVGHRQAWRTSTYLRQKETKGLGHAILLRQGLCGQTSRSPCCTATTSSSARATRPAGQLMRAYESYGQGLRGHQRGAGGGHLASTPPWR